jgi:hypothetical protein
MREEAELRRQEAELERKLEEKRKAEEAERLRRLEEEKKAAEVESRRREEAQRQAAEAERQRKLEEQRQAAEAELKRQAEADRLKDIQFREMNARELVQHQQRAAAWTLQDQRAKELAAKKIIEDAQAKIEELLRANPAQPTSALPGPKAAPLETRTIVPEVPNGTDMPPPEPLPVDEGAGPISISPNDSVTSAAGDRAEASATPQSIVPSAAPETPPSLLQRFQRLIKAPGDAKERAKIKKRQNFNR